MISLFLDTTEAKVAKVKISDGDKVLIEKAGESPLNTINDALQGLKLQLSQIDRFKSNPGPGSYTGVRVGAAVVNTLNYTLEKKAAPIEPIYQ